MNSPKLLLLIFLVFYNTSCSEKQETVQSLVDRGVDFVNRQEFEAGIALYSKAIKQNPRVQLAYYNRGIAYSELKDYTKAIADFDKVILLKSNVVTMLDRDLKPSAEG